MLNYRPSAKYGMLVEQDGDHILYSTYFGERNSIDAVFGSIILV